MTNPEVKPTGHLSCPPTVYSVGPNQYYINNKFFFFIISRPKPDKKAACCLPTLPSNNKQPSQFAMLH